MKPFNPTKYQCNNCKDIIFSRYPGEFVSCSCFKNKIGNLGIAVDQTEYYERHIGGGRTQVEPKED